MMALPAIVAALPLVGLLVTIEVLRVLDPGRYRQTIRRLFVGACPFLLVLVWAMAVWVAQLSG